MMISNKRKIFSIVTIAVLGAILNSSFSQAASLSTPVAHFETYDLGNKAVMTTPQGRVIDAFAILLKFNGANNSIDAFCLQINNPLITDTTIPYNIEPFQPYRGLGMENFYHALYLAENHSKLTLGMINDASLTQDQKTALENSATQLAIWYFTDNKYVNVNSIPYQPLRDRVDALISAANNNIGTVQTVPLQSTFTLNKSYLQVNLSNFNPSVQYPTAMLKDNQGYTYYSSWDNSGHARFYNLKKGRYYFTNIGTIPSGTVLKPNSDSANGQLLVTSLDSSYNFSSSITLSKNL